MKSIKMEDDSYQEVANFLLTGTLPTEFISTKSNFIATSNKFSLNGKCFWVRHGKLVLKKSELETVFKQIHQHSGRDITYEKLRSQFWFHGMYVWIQKKIKECSLFKQKQPTVVSTKDSSNLYSSESKNVMEGPHLASLGSKR